MHAIYDDSLQVMSRLETPPDVILLDPMFPERQKSATTSYKENPTRQWKAWSCQKTEEEQIVRREYSFL